MTIEEILHNEIFHKMEKEENNSSETDEGPKMPNKEFQENLWLMKIKWMVDIYNKKKAQMKKEGVVYN